MAESKAQTVKVIRESGESAAVVEDREQIPWSLGVDWKVMVFVPSEDPLVFVSVEQAGAWVEHDERARGLKRDFLDESTDEEGASETDSASIERDKEATERYLAFAEENGKPPNSTELFTLAHEKEIIRSLAFFENMGCTGRCWIVQSYLSDWELLGLGWVPRSCLVYRQGILYAGPAQGGQSAPVVGLACIDLPFIVRAILPL